MEQAFDWAAIPSLSGDQVNLAFKLGEDIAEGGETLLTGAVRSHLGQHPWVLEQRARHISGLDLPYWAVVNAE